MISQALKTQAEREREQEKEVERERQIAALFLQVCLCDLIERVQVYKRYAFYLTFR